MRSSVLTPLAALAALSVTAAPSAQELPSQAEMWRIIQAQQAELEALKEQLRQTDAKVAATDARVEETDAKVAATDEKAEAAVVALEESAEASGTLARWAERTQIGGYGELHYNNLEGNGGAGDVDEVDLHRFVLFFGHQFTDRLRFFSELEVEHALAGEGQNGEVELEQAFLEYDLNPHHRVRGGLQLIPVGILNQVHEPPTFYGVERNPVENNIIPTTWWEAAVAVEGEVAPRALPGLSYHVMLHSGLETPIMGGNAFRIRNGRNKVSEASADNGAVTGQLKWTGLPGVELAGSVQYQHDITQDASSQRIDAILFETHADIQRGPFGLRALYARWDLDEGAFGLGPASGPSAGRDEQYGWYVEPSYRNIRIAAIPGEFGAFFRYSEWDNNAGVSGDTGDRQYNAGFNYWPHPNVVVKADVQFQNNEDDADQDGFNLGIGYQF